MSTDLSCAKILDNSKNTGKTNSGYPKFYVLNSRLCNFMVGRITGKKYYIHARMENVTGLRTLWFFHFGVVIANLV